MAVKRIEGLGNILTGWEESGYELMLFLTAVFVLTYLLVQKDGHTPRVHVLEP